MKIRNNPQVYMEPGRYYVGDLCYVMDDSWNEVCELTSNEHNVLDGGFRLRDGREFVIFTTKWGDGTYLDKEGREYPVDAGLIGCIRVEDMDVYPVEVCDDGHMIEFLKPFICEKVDGVIYFGKIAIDTDPADYDEEEEDDDDSDD
jgi:hypothetical protein